METFTVTSFIHHTLSFGWHALAFLSYISLPSYRVRCSHWLYVSLRQGALGASWAFYVGVEPKIGRVYPPKWMVKIMENPHFNGMIWGYHYFWTHPCRFLMTFLRLRMVAPVEAKIHFRKVIKPWTDESSL